MNDSSPNSTSSSRRTFMQGALGVAGAALFSAGAMAVPGRERLATESAFLDAVRAGELGVVQGLLTAEPALLGARDPAGLSAFAVACLGGHAAVADFLVERGYAPDAHEAALALDWERLAALAADDMEVIERGHALGGTMMYCAARGGAGSDIWRVYAVGTSPNTVPEKGSPSPLQAALQFHDLEKAEMTAATLLSNGASPNPDASPEASPLHLAAQRGSSELVEMLIRHGADVAAKDDAGHTALDLARGAGHDRSTQILENHVAIPRTHSTSRTAFDGSGAAYAPADIDDIPLEDRLRFVGVSHGNLEAVKAMAAAEPRLVHSVATTGERCVEACAHTGQRAVVDFLVERGAPYALPTAVMSSDKQRVIDLLDADPLRIHERGAHDFALLWYPLIGRCELDMLETLIARGAKVEEQHLLGTTALHWAASSGALDAVSLLLESGADIHRVGRKFRAAGETPLESALRSKQTKVADLLRARGAKR